VSTAAGSDDPGCQTCVACCHAPFPGDPWVEVRPADLTPRHLTQVYESEYDRRYSQRAMSQLPGGRCVALAMLTASPADPRVGTCTIYDRRPETCRLFAPGSPLCQAARRRRGLPPLPPP
jgi:Fe-S-cluster containining protein